jgi:hypothetical protein
LPAPAPAPARTPQEPAQAPSKASAAGSVASAPAGAAATNSGGSTAASNMCSQVKQQVGIVASVLRDWESNLAVQGDVADKLDPPAQAISSLAGGASGSASTELVRLSDQIKDFRMNFMGRGGVLPDTEGYQTRKAQILAGIASC